MTFTIRYGKDSIMAKKCPSMTKSPVLLAKQALQTAQQTLYNASKQQNQ